ncbi:hypothetical protein YPPY66_4834, partial [Yersinia pestis PY-66]
MENRCQYL